MTPATLIPPGETIPPCEAPTHASSIPLSAELPTTSPDISPSPVGQSPRSAIRLSSVDWASYSRFLELFEERPAWRLTYWEGELEIMSPSYRHDQVGSFLRFIIQILTDELGKPQICGGSTTLRNPAVARGLEPDACFWIDNAARLRGRGEIDLTVDPPPDLAIEIDITSSSLDRLAIYAALGVPEIWRWDGQLLQFYLLLPSETSSSATYQIATHSRCFPQVTAVALAPFLSASTTTGDQNAILAEVRRWIATLPSEPNPPESQPQT